MWWLTLLGCISVSHSTAVSDVDVSVDVTVDGTVDSFELALDEDAETTYCEYGNSIAVSSAFGGTGIEVVLPSLDEGVVSVAESQVRGWDSDYPGCAEADAELHWWSYQGDAEVVSVDGGIEVWLIGVFLENADGTVALVDDERIFVAVPSE